MLLATALTLALLGFAVSMLLRLVRQDGDKIIAALEGRSWTAQPPALARPVTVRFSPRCTAAGRGWPRVGLRAAA